MVLNMPLYHHPNHDYEYHFSPKVTHRPDATNTVMVRKGIDWTWYYRAYKIIDLNTGKVVKDRLGTETTPNQPKPKYRSIDDEWYGHEICLQV